MAVLPSDRVSLLEFCEVHSPVWMDNSASIGLTVLQAQGVDGATSLARANYSAALEARDAAKAATLKSNASLRSMREAAAAAIRSIKTYAEMQPDPSVVYVAAQIPPPSGPTVLPAPGKPVNIVITLEPTGALTLSWDSANAAASSGVFFNVSRKLPGQPGFTLIGGTSGSTAESRRPAFTDSTLPASAASGGVQYIIQGRRGNDASGAGIPSDAVIVQFGIGGAGMAVTGATLAIAA